MKKNFKTQLMLALKPNHKQQYWFDFIIEMTKKEIKSRYKFAALGFLWIFLNPLLQMLVMGIIFKFLIKVEIEYYFLFLFSGLLPWNFFSLSLSKTTPALIHERFLIQKAKFPREGLILSIVFSYFIHLIISTSIFVIILLSHYAIQATSPTQFLLQCFSLIKIIPLSFVLLLITIGFSLFLSALNVEYRDTNFAVKALLQLWFYLTPIIYRLEILPTQMVNIMYLNPMVGIIERYQQIFLGFKPANPQLNILSILSVLIYFMVGVYTFKKRSPYFDDWL